MFPIPTSVPIHLALQFPFMWITTGPVGIPIIMLTSGAYTRVDFKVATLVHQSLSGISPPYLADDCRLVADARERRRRSTASRTCIVTRTYSTFGDRAFGAAGPGLWNSLPSRLKDADLSYSEFRRSLKTFLFGQGATAQCELVLTAPSRNILTYLLTYLLTLLSD